MDCQNIESVLDGILDGDHGLTISYSRTFFRTWLSVEMGLRVLRDLMDFQNIELMMDNILLMIISHSRTFFGTWRSMCMSDFRISR